MLLRNIVALKIIIKITLANNAVASGEKLSCMLNPCEYAQKPKAKLKKIMIATNTFAILTTNLTMRGSCKY